MTEIFDRQALLERVEGNEEFLEDLLHTFLDHTPRQLKELRRALDFGDVLQLQGQAHSIKGAAASICAETLTAAALQVELAAKKGALEVAKAEVENLAREFERLKELVRGSSTLAALPEGVVCRNPGEPILVVDDDPVQHTLIKNYLKNWQVTLASSAAEALKIMQQEGHLVVLADLYMPEMDGLQMLQRIKQANGIVQVIVITAQDRVEELIKVLKAGASDFLLKPLDKKVLEDVLESTLSRIHRWKHTLMNLPK